MKGILSALCLLTITLMSGNAQDHSMHMHMDGTSMKMNHETHLITTGPIGVMGDHMHHKGSFMMSYRLMGMKMSGVRNGSEGVEDTEVFTDFMVSPQKMNMQMHMLGAMYAVSDRFTLMMMSNYLDNDMTLKMRMGMEFETQSSGFGDLSVSGLVKLIERPTHSVHLITGVSIPLGSIDSRSQTPMSSDAILAYPMQLGSGTWDPFIGLNYSGQSDQYIWGAQGRYRYRIGTNAEDYALGNHVMLTTWGAIKASDNLNFSLRARYKNQAQIEGANQNMNAMMMPLFNTSNSGSEIVNLSTGINYFVNQGSLRGIRLGIEAGYNVYQKYNGYQMDQNLEWNIGMQYVFGQQH